MAAMKWKIEGPHFINCNCDYGCPCQYVALPTDGTCKAVVAFRIDKGNFGDTHLDGLMAFNTYDWPGAIHEGNGSLQSIIDERADEAQRQGLAAIMQGEGAEPGSTMLQIYRSMCTTYHEPLFMPGDTGTLTFTAPDEPGEIQFRCDFHPDVMTGTITVE